MAPPIKQVMSTDRHPFLLSVEDVAKQLSTNIESGLSARQVLELQRSNPPNELEGGGGVPWYKIFIKQLTNAMILVGQIIPWVSELSFLILQVLVFAMGLSFGVGDYIEGGVLAAVIFLNVSIGFFQEFQAEKKMDSLRALSSPSAAVLRDGKIDVIPR
jgi:Na+-exporting ATPase